MSGEEKPSDYVRCAECKRLVHRTRAIAGPENGLYGSECIKRAVRAAAAREQAK